MWCLVALIAISLPTIFHLFIVKIAAALAVWRGLLIMSELLASEDLYIC